MKKVLISILCSALLLSACNEDDNNLNKEKYIDLSKNLVQDMQKDIFTTTTQLFDEEIAKVLDTNALKTAWDTTVIPLGSYINHNSVLVTENKDYITIEIIEEYENNGLKIIFTFNEDEKLAGINLNYATIEKDLISSNDFEEIPLAIGNEFSLNGILTLPKNTSTPPVILLVHGSGPNDKNSTIFVNTPFQDIAHKLAKMGIATYRYDKRFYTYPESAASYGFELGLEEEVLEDVDFALNMLKKEKRIDSENIFVLGHSLGAGLTPYIAHEYSFVKGIISLAGSLRPLYEISYDQNKATESLILNGIFDETTVTTIKAQMVQVEKDINILRGDLTAIPNEQILLGLPAGYQKSTKEFAGENYISKINVPILALQGTADFQVSATIDFPLWQTALADNNNSECILYENLNHLMMQTTGKQDITDYQVKSTVAPEVITDIAGFILKNR